MLTQAEVTRLAHAIRVERKERKVSQEDVLTETIADKVNDKVKF